MQTIWVELADKAYPIYIGQGLLHQPDLFARALASRRPLLVTNETISPLYAGTVQASIGAATLTTCLLPDGEQYKTLSTLDLIFDALLQAQYHRHSALIALGGGVVGDITGFAAACYQRGIDYIQVPTTLLAQVDSSVGGKTAVNHALGKNMIGAFHQPRAVLIDIETLTTLDTRQFKAGLAEVIKYGLILDADFFAWLEANIDAVLNKSADALIHLIARACQLKADIVARDECDITGERALLNFGHTFGHALEQVLGYGTWLHGEAVAAGMVIASHLSCQLGWLDKTAVQRIRQLLEKIGLPIGVPAHVGANTLVAAMQRDKKREAKALPLILLKNVGNACIYRQATPDVMINAITQTQQE